MRDTCTVLTISQGNVCFVLVLQGLGHFKILLLIMNECFFFFFVSINNLFNELQI
jgi:hypothetical protein